MTPVTRVLLRHCRLFPVLPKTGCQILLAQASAKPDLGTGLVRRQSISQ